MDISKFYKSLDAARKDIEKVATDLRRVEKEASFVDGIIAEKIPVNIAAIREALEHIVSDDGTGTMNGVMNILLGVSGADLLSDDIKMEREKSSGAKPAAPAIDTTPHTENGAQSSILGESKKRSLKDFYKDPMKESASLAFGPTLNYAELLDNPYLSGGDPHSYESDFASNVDDFGFGAMDRGLANDPAAEYSDDAVQFNGDFDDFANDLDPNGMSFEDIRNKYEEPAEEFVGGEEVTDLNGGAIPPNTSPADIEDNIEMPPLETVPTDDGLAPIPDEFGNETVPAAPAAAPMDTGFGGMPDPLGASAPESDFAPMDDMYA